MKIIYPKDKNQKKEYLWEAYKVRTKIKAIKKKPTLSFLSFEHDKNQMRSAPIFYVFAAVVILLSKFHWFFILFFACLFFLIHMAKKNIQSIEKGGEKEEKERSLHISPSQITHEEKDNLSYSISWSNVDFILVRKYGIYIIPKDDNFLISLPIENKKEFDHELKKQKIDIKTWIVMEGDIYDRNQNQ